MIRDQNLSPGDPQIHCKLSTEIIQNQIIKISLILNSNKWMHEAAEMKTANTEILFLCLKHV